MKQETPTIQQVDKAMVAAMESLRALGVSATLTVKVRIGEHARIELSMETQSDEDYAEEIYNDDDDEESALCEGCGVLPAVTDELCEVCNGSLTGGANV